MNSNANFDCGVSKLTKTSFDDNKSNRGASRRRRKPLLVGNKSVIRKSVALFKSGKSIRTTRKSSSFDALLQSLLAKADKKTVSVNDLNVSDDEVDFRAWVDDIFARNSEAKSQNSQQLEINNKENKPINDIERKSSFDEILSKLFTPNIAARNGRRNLNEPLKSQDSKDKSSYQVYKRGLNIGNSFNENLSQLCIANSQQLGNNNKENLPVNDIERKSSFEEILSKLCTPNVAPRNERRNLNMSLECQNSKDKSSYQVNKNEFNAGNSSNEISSQLCAANSQQLGVNNKENPPVNNIESKSSFDEILSKLFTPSIAAPDGRRILNESLKSQTKDKSSSQVYKNKFNAGKSCNEDLGELFGPSSVNSQQLEVNGKENKLINDIESKSSFDEILLKLCTPNVAPRNERRNLNMSLECQNSKDKSSYQVNKNEFNAGNSSNEISSRSCAANSQRLGVNNKENSPVNNIESKSSFDEILLKLFTPNGTQTNVFDNTLNDNITSNQNKLSYDISIDNVAAQNETTNFNKSSRSKSVNNELESLEHNMELTDDNFHLEKLMYRPIDTLSYNLQETFDHIDPVRNVHNCEVYNPEFAGNSNDEENTPKLISAKRNTRSGGIIRGLPKKQARTTKFTGISNDEENTPKLISAKRNTRSGGIIRGPPKKQARTTKFTGISNDEENTPKLISAKRNTRSGGNTRGRPKKQARTTIRQMDNKLHNILNILALDSNETENSNNFLSYCLNAEFQTIRFSNISKIATEKWLCSIIPELANKYKPNKNLATEIYAKCSDLTKANHDNISFKRYRKNNLVIYRCQKAKIKRTLVDFDAETLIKKLTGNCEFTQDEMYSEIVVPPKSVSSSYIPDDISDSMTFMSEGLTDAEVKLRMGINAITRNKALLHQDNRCHMDIDKNKIKQIIQDIFQQVFNAFNNGNHPGFIIRNQNYTNCIIKDHRLQIKPFGEAKRKMVQYRRFTSRFKFCLMLYIMAKIYTLLESNCKITKREIYYQVKHIPGIRNQGFIDRAIQEVSCLLNVGQWHLNIIAHRGLVYGNLKLIMSSGETTNCNVPGTMIPFDFDDIMEVQSTAYFILVVEKESIFHKLIDEDLPNKLTRPFIMITGKGVPDLNTQLFLKRLCTIMAVPVFILVDADPDGIKIMLNYRFGSVNSSHLSDYLALPNIRWLGVFPSEISKYGIKNLKLSQRDTRLAHSLMISPYMEGQPRIMEQLDILLLRNKKASIEGLIKTNTFLSESYLPSKLFNQDFI